MAWNEPGNNGNDNDPWGGGRRGGDQGPPDIDEVIKDLTKRFNGLLGASVPVLEVPLVGSLGAIYLGVF